MCSVDLGESNGIVFAEFRCVVDEIRAEKEEGTVFT